MSEKTFYFVFALSHMLEHGGENVSAHFCAFQRAEAQRGGRFEGKTFSDTGE